MGGFMRHQPNKTDRTLYPIQPRGAFAFSRASLDALDEVDFPDITEEEIRDRSKGDIVSKGLVMIQTGWFVVQCVTRGAQGLPITELEIATLAFAVLNFVTYILWWNKPLNVDRPYVIGRREWGQQVEERTFWVRIKETAKTIGRVPHDAVENIKEYMGLHTLKNVWKLFRDYFVSRFFELGGQDSEEGVSTFYSGDLEGHEDVWIASLSAFIAIVFGAIHCIAWSFHFPSHIEEMLWRISSLITVSAPLLLFASFMDITFDILSDTLCFMLTSLALVSTIAYVLARLTLLALAFSSLRELPPGAYETVSWTTYIPHV